MDKRVTVSITGTNDVSVKAERASVDLLRMRDARIAAMKERRSRCPICKERPGTVEYVPPPMADEKKIICTLCHERIKSRRSEILDDE